jgi:uncharacterized RDD family membrane protein YckC
MQTIEINTAQNVKIEYQLAGVGHRIFAYIIDFIIMMAVFFIMFFSMLSFSNGSETINSFMGIFAFIWFGFYTLISELIGNGQTIGKLALGIKVIKLNGDELEFYDYFSRWSLRLIDIYASIGCIAMFLVASNKNGQRLGDIIAGTSVIRKKSNYGFSLDDILKLNLNSKDNYEFMYPQAAKLDEKDVILIKQLLFRKRLYQNQAHEAAMDKLVSKLSGILELQHVPDNKELFLSKVISEYIILTR